MGKIVGKGAKKPMKTADAKKIAKLEKENQALKAELDALKATLPQQ